MWLPIQGMREIMVDLIWMKLMKIGSRLGCHQRADRSFSVGHYQFPVCARCMGILISTIIAYITFFKRRVSVIKCVCMLMPLVIDGTLQYLEVYESNNKRRFITGLFWGFGCTHIRLNFFKYLIDSLNKVSSI